MVTPQADARHTCDMLIASLRESNLNFLVQETPFSAFITIRKTFCRGAYKSVKNPVPEVNAELGTAQPRLVSFTFVSLM